MKITVYGSGYVGLVVAACFAQTGNHVVCMDIDEHKVSQLNKGKIPIYEPGLAELIQEHQQYLIFTTDPIAAAQHGQVQFIAVGTPGDEFGKVNMQYVEAVAKNIAAHIHDYTVVVNKSTVPIGAASLVTKWLQSGLKSRNVNVPFDVVANPEFLREGCALKDFCQPDRIVVGTQSVKAVEVMKTLYAPFNRDNNKLMFMGVRSAELCKYAANAFLATKISFMNQMANLAENVDADIEEVRLGLGRDTRIGPDFLYAGCGYGGSCFGKDCQALLNIAKEKNVNLSIVAQAEQANREQKLKMVEKVDHILGSSMKNKVIAIWGLSFKPGTDDLRDAPSMLILQALHEKGAITQVYDPQAMNKAKGFFPESRHCLYADDKLDALEGASAVLILTEWSEFKQPDFTQMKNRLLNPIVIDGRNMYDPTEMQTNGFEYYAVGRGAKTPNTCD